MHGMLQGRAVLERPHTSDLKTRGDATFRKIGAQISPAGFFSDLEGHK